MYAKCLFVNALSTGAAGMEGITTTYNFQKTGNELNNTIM